MPGSYVQCSFCAHRELVVGGDFTAPWNRCVEHERGHVREALLELAGELVVIVNDCLHGEDVWSWCDDLTEAKHRIATQLERRGLKP